MRVSKKYIGKVVEVRWRDPVEIDSSATGETPSIDVLPKGKSGLARWVEWGVIDDIREGVVRMKYSQAWHWQAERPDKYKHTLIPASLIEEIRIVGEASEEY